MSPSETVGIVGLGVMGSAMAHNLMAAGFEVMGYDLHAAKVEALAAEGGSGARSSSEVADRCGIVIVSVPSPRALADVSRDIAAGVHPGSLILETGTLPLDDKTDARDVLAQAGAELMDVPLSGTGLQAADATLVVFASGSPEGYDRARPVFGAISEVSHYLGEFGNGSKMKYVANLLVAVHTLAAAEAHALGMAAGLDPAVIQEVVGSGVGTSRMFDIRGPMMVADAYLPPSARLDIILKDASIIRSFAEGVGAATPLLDAALPLYQRASEEGLGDLDAASLMRLLEGMAGLRASGDDGAGG